MEKKQASLPKAPSILFSGLDNHDKTKMDSPSSAPREAIIAPHAQPPSSSADHPVSHSNPSLQFGPSSVEDADYAQRHISMLTTLKNSQIIRSGYLLKRRRTRKSWKKRWFVLRSSHISIYDSDKEYTTKHLLLLSDIQTVSRTRLRHHPFAWALFTKPRTWYFDAGSEAEAVAWISDIKHLIAEASPPLPENTKLPPFPGSRSKTPPLSPSSYSSSSSCIATTPTRSTATSAAPGLGYHYDMLSPTFSELACSSPDFSSDAASPKSNDSIQLSTSPKLSHSETLALEANPPHDAEASSSRSPHHSHHYSHLFRRRKPKKVDILDFESHLLENMKLEDAKLVMQGYLDKYHGPYRKWTRHWFVLRDFNLACYENEKEYVLLRLTRLQKVTSIQAWESIGKHHPYTIKIETVKKSFVIAAESLKDFHAWLNALREQHARIFNR